MADGATTRVATGMAADAERKSHLGQFCTAGHRRAPWRGCLPSGGGCVARAGCDAAGG